MTSPGRGGRRVAAHVADDQRPVAEGQLRAMALADPHALDEPERRPEPLDRLAHIGVDEHRHDRGLRDGAVVLHATLQDKRPPILRMLSSAIPDDDALRAILAAVETLLPSPDRWETPGSYDSVGLADHRRGLVDRRPLPERGQRHRPLPRRAARRRRTTPRPTAPATSGASSRRAAAPRTSRERMGNRQRTSTTNGILKAEAVLHEARILEDEGVELTADLTAASQERLDHLQGRWSTVAGQGSGVSWRAFSMLVGLPEVKPDRMIRRFAAAALGRPAGDRGRRRRGARPRAWPPRRASACRPARSTTPSGPTRAASESGQG